MIYFLINNNIHLIDVEDHLSELKNQKVGLIKIPHKLTIQPNHKFEVELEYSVLIRGKKDYFNISRINAIHKQIKSDLVGINKDDTLIFYTELEFLNHYVIRLFKDKGAQTIMLDEGFATYEALSKQHLSKISFKESIINNYFKYLLGYKYTSVAKVNGVMRPHIADNYIDKVLLYNKTTVDRNLQTHLLSRKYLEYNDLDSSSVIFLNEDIYGWFVTMDEYIFILSDILDALSNQFKTVYFKYHPRESQEQRKAIGLVVEKFKKVTVLNDDRPVELIINNIKTQYISSFFASTLLNHSNSNCIALYLFHLYPQIMRNPIFENLKRSLINLDYNFPESLSDIRSDYLGFQKEDDIKYKKMTLNEIL